jgi:hypothetical protein
MQTTSRAHITQVAHNRHQAGKTCPRPTLSVPCVLSAVHRVFSVAIYAIVGVLLGAAAQSTTAQQHYQPRTMSQTAAPIRLRPELSATLPVEIALPPGADGAPGQTFHLAFATAQEPPTTTAAVQPPTSPSFAYRRFTILAAIDDKTDFPFVITAGVLDRLELDMAESTDIGLSTVTLGVWPRLAWANYGINDALQFRVDRFGTLSDFMFPPAVPPLLPALPYAQLWSQALTVAQVHGALALETAHDGQLRYALYAGTFAAEPRQNLVAGASIGYTSGTTGFVLGIGYLYGPHAVGLGVFGDPFAGATGYVPGRDFGVLGMYRLADQDRRLIENQLLHGLTSGDNTPLAVRAKSVFYINHQWTIYHRFDRLRLGQGLKISEHIIGVRFFLNTKVSLHAEVMVGHIDGVELGAPVDAGGLRLTGTFYF